MPALYISAVTMILMSSLALSTADEEKLRLESMKLVEAVKVGTPETRARAVATLVGLRDQIESVLVDAVTQVNEGQAEAGIKGGAIYVLGKLGCASGRDLLDAEREFFWAPGPPEGFHGGGANIDRYGGVGIWALENAGFSDKVFDLIDLLEKDRKVLAEIKFVISNIINSYCNCSKEIVKKIYGYC